MPILHTHLATTHSTNSQLIEWMTQSHANKSVKNTPHFSQCFLLTADSQTGGRGQHGRTWQSPLGNVYLSLYVPTVEFTEEKNHALQQRLDGRLSLCVGYQLSQLPPMTQITDSEKIGVKWVNDVGFYQNQQFNKLAGTLIEPVSVAGKLVGIVVGVGMNITQAPILTSQTQEGLNYKAVSIQDLVGQAFPANDFYQPITHAILQAIEQFNGFDEASNVEDFLQRFQSHDILLGKNLQITLPSLTHIIGVAHGIDHRGCLQILQNDGTITSIWTGTLQVLA